MHRFKYLLVFVLPSVAYLGFTSDGWPALLPVVLIFIVFPLLELFLPVDSANFDEKRMADERDAKFYDWLLYLATPIYLATFVYFFMVIADTPLWSLEFWARTATMGLIGGIFGFNIGHELGHRVNEPLDYTFGRIMLLSVLNLHFIPYHNGGHHRNVGKASDPATASKGELLYTFWFRSQIGGYMQAWQMENELTRHKGKAVFSLHNRMVRYTLVTIAFLLALLFVLGQKLFFIYLLVVFISTCLLETINYIEHYGLERKQIDHGRYEPVRHHHSWNSDHIFGRALLFNLSRHSDHHYNGSKKYQTLLSLPDTPQMPTGYPGMIVLAVFQPIWFYIMDRRLEEVTQGKGAVA